MRTGNAIKPIPGIGQLDRWLNTVPSMRLSDSLMSRI